MNFHPTTFNLMLSEGDSYAHAAGGNVRYSCATNAGADANLFQYPVTLGSLADLSSDSEVEIIEAIGMHMLKIPLFVKSRVSLYMTVHTRSRPPSISVNKVNV